jgi:uncharacterized C2H2 Zn-finger protein
MESKDGDDHLHHRPVCEVYDKEFDDIRELIKHVNQEHKNQHRAA